jgi:hypothetical protein
MDGGVLPRSARRASHLRSRHRVLAFVATKKVLRRAHNQRNLEFCWTARRGQAFIPKPLHQLGDFATVSPRRNPLKLGSLARRRTVCHSTGTGLLKVGRAFRGDDEEIPCGAWPDAHAYAVGGRKAGEPSTAGELPVGREAVKNALCTGPLFAVGDARSASTTDSGTRRPLRARHDAAVHAPESGSIGQCDSSVGSGPSCQKLWRHFWRRERGPKERSWIEQVN